MSEAADERGVREELMRKVRTEGVTVAYDTAVGICRDPKAPAPAKATALTALFRVGGYFANTDSGEEKEPHEMSAAELSAAVEKVTRQFKAKETEASVEDADGRPYTGGLFD
jgi:hypothetical protein